MTVPKPAIRVLIVDDHPVVRAGLSSMLGMRPEIAVVGSAGSCAEARLLLTAHAVQVILLDLRMPGVDGLTFLKQLAQQGEAARVIVLTSYERDEEIYRAVQAGAQGYLTKDASEAEMVDAIEKVHAGSRVLPPHIGSRLADRLTRSPLTQREEEILRELARGLSNREIGKALRISENTVRNHMNSLLSKLGAGDRTEAVALGIRRGIVDIDRISEKH